MVEYVAESEFEGIPTLPAEAQYTVDMARKFPKIVKY